MMEGILITMLITYFVALFQSPTVDTKDNRPSKANSLSLHCKNSH